MAVMLPSVLGAEGTTGDAYSGALATSATGGTLMKQTRLPADAASTKS